MAIPATEFDFVEEVIRDVIRSDARLGSLKRGLRHPNRVRRFLLTWRLASLADKNTVQTEFDNAKGKAGTFSYTPVDEVSAVTVRFQEDSFRWEWVSPGRVTMSLVLEQEVEIQGVI